MKRAGALTTGLLVALVLYTASVPIPANVLLSPRFRVSVYNNRPFFVVAVFGLLIVALLASNHERLRRAAANRSVVSLFLVSLAFPVYYTLVSVVKDRYSVPILGLYWLWMIGSFGLAPVFVQSVDDLRVAMKALVVAALLVLAGSTLLSVIYDVRDVMPWAKYSGLKLLFGPQVPLGFINNNFYALTPQVLCFCSSLLLLLHPPDGSRREKRFLILCLFGALLLALVTEARNAALALVVFIGCLMMLRRGKGGLPAFFLAALAAMLVGTVVLLWFDYEQLNSIATGRLNFWRFMMENITDGDAPMREMLFGPSEIRGYTEIQPYDPLVGEKVYTKLHVDNFYLELILEGGVIGTVLFLLPYAEAVGRAFNLVTEGGESRAIGAWSLAVYLSVGVQGVFVATFPTFNSHIGMFWLVFAAAPATLWFTSYQGRNRIQPSPSNPPSTTANQPSHRTTSRNKLDGGGALTE